jgi:hypothetical protein
MTALSELVATQVPTDAQSALETIHRTQTDLEMLIFLLEHGGEPLPRGAMVYLAAMNVGLEQHLPFLQRH